MKKLATLLFLLSFSVIAQAQTAVVSLSDDSAQFKYAMLTGGQSFGRSEFGFGFLYNEQDAYIFETSLVVVDEAGASTPGLHAGLGGKLYGASKGEAEFLALGLGGMVRYALPANTRLAFALDGYYAPEITSFMDAANFVELALRAEYEVLQTAAAFLEFRKFSTKVDGGSEADLDDGIRLGIRLDF
ncbi:MAG: YfaZ family protein [Gammaproteobacteria bacterium]|nr:YfaZ family protein [Gammaproteobacteria bacterium]MDH5692186.1 YfaZ family protein [Gammaproteobacteria bacterium]